jgi:alkanesulfonate monooxygenase SsuD/methylene tetrahydromethanopterin reductase-like flavin-dependent oxidoreductase (luciferase family)
MRSTVRFNLVSPGLRRTDLAERHRAFCEMARFADESGFDIISLEEHHGADNGWSPSPLVLAGMVVGATTRIGVSISALLGPLHDPLRVAEDLAVLDLAGGGRVITTFGIGYRPEEYAQQGKSWDRRGELMDEFLDTVLKAWTGEPFDYRGNTVRVTPVPLTQPHPFVMIGGTSKVAARRAARFGLPMFAAAHAPDLERYYYEQCRAFGTESFFASPSAGLSVLHVCDDPDRSWATYGSHFLHEAQTYASWQTPDIRSAMKSAATTVQQLREEGLYRMVTPEECIEIGRRLGPTDTLLFHPLCGGMPVDEGWRCLRLVAERVLPTASNVSA